MTPCSLVLNIYLKNLKRVDPCLGARVPGLEIRFVFGCIQWLTQKESLSRGQVSAEKAVNTRLHFVLESTQAGGADGVTSDTSSSPHLLFLKEFLDEFCRLRADQCSTSSSKLKGSQLRPGEQARDLEFDLVGQEDLRQLPLFLNFVEENPHLLVLGSSPYRGKGAWIFSRFRAWPLSQEGRGDIERGGREPVELPEGLTWTSAISKLIAFKNRGGNLLAADLDSSDLKKPRVPLRNWGQVISLALRSI